MNDDNKNKGGMIVLLIFLLICSGLGIAAFVMSLKGCSKDGFAEEEEEDVFDESHQIHPFYTGTQKLVTMVADPIEPIV